ncbi:TraR/DksA family transcriptional regulator [Nevskia soli]|uniref:TraR/DksA family transcriptional regulator n=1 Tax=Nevskia soli TaxID=418856 RepID=UPI0015D7AF7C|nr:TraR/DksA C4-type zinc finger protein [Nevskia soli]
MIDIQHFKSKLQAREQELLNDRRTSEQEVLDAPSAEVEDALDLANSGEAREDAERSLDREYSELEEIQDALKRIDAGTYGVCEICGKPIEPARLEAVPWTRYCLNDAKQREHFTPTGNL